MDFEIAEVRPESLSAYADIPSAFAVASVLEVEPIDAGLGGLRLVERRLPETYVKDYDAYEDQPPPAPWLRFDVSNWLFVMALADGMAAGAAAVAFRSPTVNMLEGRADLAALWDLRVRPNCRRHGVGARLFRYAADWSRRHGCRQLKIETQNVNVPACRFYAAQGCYLGAIQRHAYGEAAIAHEAMLIWYLDLDDRQVQRPTA